MSDLAVKKQLLVCPGVSVRDAAASLDLGLAELSQQLSRSETETEALLNCHAPLTPELAGLLETALQIDADFWFNLEAAYRPEVAEIARMEAAVSSPAPVN